MHVAGCMGLPCLQDQKAEKVELSLDKLTASSEKGYRMVRATRGITDGAWYFEILVKDLGKTGHTRLGWSTWKGDLQAPVGFDLNSYAYRSLSLSSHPNTSTFSFQLTQSGDFQM